MKNATSSQRLTRLQTALQAILLHEQFSLHQVKESLPEEKPRYVTQLVHQLQRQGHLTANDEGYCWTCEPETFPAEAWLKAQVHGTQLPQTPAVDRPRERLLAQGPAALRSAELLAILIRSGRKGESALQAGEKIAARYKDQLHRLVDAGRGELKDIAAAVGETAYCQIMAGIELGRRITRAFQEQAGRPQRLTCSDDALAFCRRHFERLASDAASEEFHIVTLDTQCQVIGVHRISVGTLDRSLIHPREVFRPAIKDAAKSIILVHNHPSGDPTPSDEDLLVTRRLEQAGSTLGVQVLDHIVVARGGEVSIRDFLDLQGSQKR